MSMIPCSCGHQHDAMGLEHLAVYRDDFGVPTMIQYACPTLLPYTNLASHKTIKWGDAPDILKQRALVADIGWLRASGAV